MTVLKAPLHDRLLTEVAPVRGSSGDTPRNMKGESPRLSAYLRFPDLVEANIVRNWTQLQRLIEFEGFPQGIRLSANARAWAIGEVQAWLASRPPASPSGVGSPPPCLASEKKVQHDR